MTATIAPTKRHGRFRARARVAPAQQIATSAQEARELGRKAFVAERKEAQRLARERVIAARDERDRLEREHTARAVAVLKSANHVCEKCGRRAKALYAVDAPAPRDFIAVCSTDFIGNSEGTN